MRNEVQEFAEEMERVMSKHDAKKGNSWRDANVFCDNFLFNKLREEFAEILQKDASKDEFVDLANICMMLWWRRKHFVEGKL